jgi:uncharacterized protein with ATP-grasp and redox domains
MKTYLDCVPCFLRQALEAARLAGATEKQQKKILMKLARKLLKISLDMPPSATARDVFRIVNKVIRSDQDAFAEIKDKSNLLVLKFYDQLKAKIDRSHDKLLTAVKLAIAGNIIDYGAKIFTHPEEEIEKILREENKIIRQENKRLFNYQKFKSTIKKSNTILYLGDNAGEIVFDRLLIGEIKEFNNKVKIIFAVRGKPIINDALRKDAYQVGINKVAEVISSGADTPGTVLNRCTKKFLKIYKRADMVISKGQGNFEALSEAKRSIFFLFMVKCAVIAGIVKSRVGDIALIYHSGQET